MGVNSGLLIHYFKSKEGLIMEMVEYLYQSSMNKYLKELESHTNAQDRLETLLDILFDTSGTRPQRDAVFWSCYAMGFRDDAIREKIKGMMEKFIEFGIDEVTNWEENDLVSVKDKSRASAIILALHEGFGILRNSIDDPKTLVDVAQFMKTTALSSLNSSVPVS